MIEGHGIQPHFTYPLGQDARESYLDHVTDLLLLQK